MNETIQCIFCLKEKEGSKEHVFPDAIGGHLIIKNVCKACNDNLGNIDHLITNDPTVELIRFVLKLRGKKGDLPNPFKNSVLDDPRIKKEKIQTTIDHNTGKLKVKTFPELIQDENEFTLSINKDDLHKAEEIIYKKFERMGIDKGQVIIKDREHVIIEKPKLIGNFKIDLDSHLNGLLKIAYELACYKFGQSFLNAAMAGEIRECLNKNYSPLKVNDLVLTYGLIIGGEIHNYFDTLFNGFFKKDCHHVIFFKKRNDVCCYVNIFNMFGAVFLIYNSKEEILSEQIYLMRNDVVGGKFEESSLIDILNRAHEEL